MVEYVLVLLVLAGAPGTIVLVPSRPSNRPPHERLRNHEDEGTDPRDRPFRIASVTKTFVATVVLQLIGEGKLSLGDTVERWLPGLVPNGERITVRQLLNRTSGLFDHADGDDRVRTRGPTGWVS